MKKLLLAFVFLAYVPAQADTVRLLNEDRISGTVNSIVDGVVTLETALLGTILIPLDQVVAIDKTGPITVATASGDTFTGVLSSTANGSHTLQTNSGTQPLALMGINKALDGFVTPIDMYRTWDTRVDVGYVMSKGNSNTESFSVHGESIYKYSVFEHRAFLFIDEDEAEDETTRDQFEAGYNFRWYFRDAWYALGNAGYFKDKLKEIDRRITVGAGVGHQFWDTERGALSTELGITQVFEKLAGESETNPAIRWGANFNHWIQPERTEVFYNHEVLKILDSDRGEIFNASGGVRFRLSDMWNTYARVDLTHETEPPAGAHKSDITYVFGVGFLF